MIPLKKASNLHMDVTLATKLFSMCEGYIGELSTLLTDAAVFAIHNKSEQITLKVLESIDWISPSARKRQLDGLS